MIYSLWCHPYESETTIAILRNTLCEDRCLGNNLRTYTISGWNGNVCPTIGKALQKCIFKRKATLFIERMPYIQQPNVLYTIKETDERIYWTVMIFTIIIITAKMMIIAIHVLTVCKIIQRCSPGYMQVYGVYPLIFQSASGIPTVMCTY